MRRSKIFSARGACFVRSIALSSPWFQKFLTLAQCMITDPSVVVTLSTNASRRLLRPELKGAFQILLALLRLLLFKGVT